MILFKLSKTGDRPFVCNQLNCGKQFITKGHLKTHELIHTGDKPYTCEICNKEYSRKNRLNIHKRTHVRTKILMTIYRLVLSPSNASSKTVVRLSPSVETLKHMKGFTLDKNLLCALRKGVGRNLPLKAI